MTALLQAAQALTPLTRQGNEWHGPCPACGGKDRFWIGPGGIADTGIYACRHCKISGNAVEFKTRFCENSKAAARVELGLDTPDDWLKAPWDLGEEVCRYSYTDKEGGPTLDVVRFECPPDHPLYRTSDGKTFRPTTPGGSHYKRPNVPHFLYRLPPLAEAIRAGETILFCEGEKDADNGALLDFAATTNEGGAGKWKREYSEQLRGADVVLLADFDEAGEGHARRVADELRGIAASVRIVRLPELPAKGDLSDWIAAGGTREELDSIIAETPVETHWEPTLTLAPSHEQEPGFLSAHPPTLSGQKGNGAVAEILSLFRSAAELEADPAPETRYRSPGLFPYGALVQLTGAVKGGGKTTFLIYALAAILRGARFLGERTERCPVVYLTEQGRSSFEREYLERAGLMGNPDFHVLYGFETQGKPFDTILEAAVEKCRREGAGVLAVDTFGYWARVRDENDAAEMQRAQRPFQDAAASDLTVVSVHHDRKGGGEAFESGRGSSAFAGAVDVIVNLRRVGNGMANVRELRCEGRFGGLYDSLMIELTNEGYVTHGTSADVRKAEAEREIRAALPTSEGDALTIAELKPDGVGRSTAQRAIDAMLSRGEIRVIGQGKKGDPYRYYLPFEEHINGAELAKKVSAHIDGGHGQKELITGDGASATVRLSPSLLDEG